MWLSRHRERKLTAYVLAREIVYLPSINEIERTSRKDLLSTHDRSNGIGGRVLASEERELLVVQCLYTERDAIDACCTKVSQRLCLDRLGPCGGTTQRQTSASEHERESGRVAHTVGFASIVISSSASASRCRSAVSITALMVEGSASDGVPPPK